MGWTAPFTAVTGVLVTAAQLNASYRDNLNFLNSTPGCRLRRVANQSIANITPTSISWDQEDLDTDGFITTPSTTITIPAGLDGRFAITVFAQAAANLNNRCYIDIIPTSAPPATATRGTWRPSPSRCWLATRSSCSCSIRSGRRPTTPPG